MLQCFAKNLITQEENYMKLQNKKITIFLFGIYFAALIWIILFKMDLSILSFRQPRSMNLIPFSASAISNGTIDLSELLNNILIFIPCGIYACMLLPERSFFIKVLPAFFISLDLELFQFLLAVGACDITDLINNTFGGIIGIILYWIFSKIFKKHTNAIINLLAFTATTLMLAFIAILLIGNA